MHKKAILLASLKKHLILKDAQSLKRLKLSIETQ